MEEIYTCITLLYLFDPYIGGAVRMVGFLQQT